MVKIVSGYPKSASPRRPSAIGIEPTISLRWGDNRLPSNVTFRHNLRQLILSDRFTRPNLSDDGRSGRETGRLRTVVHLPSSCGGKDRGQAWGWIQ
jgi:hypothetical protein